MEKRASDSFIPLPRAERHSVRAERDWDFSQSETYDIQVSLNLEGRKREGCPLLEEVENLLETKKDKLGQEL